MSKQAEKKSSHLQSLESAFEKRTRRFSAFDVLGLDKDGNTSEASADSAPVDAAVPTEAAEPEVIAPSPSLEPAAEVFAKGEITEHPQEGGSHTRVGVTHTPVEPTHTQGGGYHSRGGGIHSKVVVHNINTTTLEDHTQGSSIHPQEGGSHTHVDNTHTPQDDFGFEEQNEKVKENKREVRKRTSPKKTASKLLAADVVATANVRSQLGVKARRVLGYLDSIRSLEIDEYTVPVGYGRICSEAGVDHHYLRRNVIPKLAMLGLIAIERKDFNGTIYHLQCSSAQVELITSEPSNVQFSSKSEPVSLPQSADGDFSQDTELEGDFPDWVDKEQWGWLSVESLKRLVDKAGSEAKANEKLDILIYNESHGAEGQRVRNRRSVLSHYLRSDEAEIWPNDDGFETLEMKRAKHELQQAKREKEIAEQALAEREATKILKFKASLNDAQLGWFKQESKRRVDARPEAKMLTKRFPLYRAEEEDLVSEWLERAEYGETVPEGEG